MENFIVSHSYLAILVLTICEAACLPFPSEITLGLGGALASGYAPSGHAVAHHPTLALVIVVGVCGEMIGSYAAYVVGRTGGRAAVDRFGKYLLLSHKDLDRAEAWFARRGELAVMVGRVIPLVRAFISLPAGVAEMDPLRFGLYTVVGVTAWVGALASVGYALGSSWHTMVKGFGAAGYVAAVVVAVALVLGLVHRIRTVRAAAAAGLGADASE